MKVRSWSVKRVLDKARLLEGVQEWCEPTNQMRERERAAEEVLGRTSETKPSGDMKTWWRSDEVRVEVKAKKDAEKIQGKSGPQRDRKTTTCIRGKQRRKSEGKGTK